MKNKPVFKPLAKTVTTEIKHAIVDSVRRVGRSFHSVATRVTKAPMTETEIIVGPDQSYTLKDVHNVVSIQSPFPIVAKFTGFGVLDDAEQSTTEQIFFDATLDVGRADAGRFVSVRVNDADIYTEAPLQAEVVNLRTGETEYIQLNKESDGNYAGFFQTQNNDAVGTNFDDVLFCRVNDSLRVTYEEAFAANGKSREVVQDVVVTLDFLPTIIECPGSIPFNKPLNLRIKNPAGMRVKVQNKRTLYSSEQHIGTYLPILMAYENGPGSMDVQNGDIIEISTLGKDDFGTEQMVSRSISIADQPVMPALTVVSITDIKQPLTIVVQDDNLPASARIKVTNGITSDVSEYEMVEEYANSGRYSYTLPSTAHLGLPGQLLVLSYTSPQGLVVQKNVTLIMEQTPECNEASAPSAPVSNPVVFNINGLFVLNGSFAGTIELSAPDLVRCTIIKA